MVKFYGIRKCLTKKVTLKLSPETIERSQGKNDEHVTVMKKKHQAAKSIAVGKILEMQKLKKKSVLLKHKEETEMYIENHSESLHHSKYWKEFKYLLLSLMRNY